MYQINIGEFYVMQESGGINLSTFALKQLNWLGKNCIVEQYMDVPNERILVIEKDYGLRGWAKDIEGIHPLFKTCALGGRGYLTIDRAVRERFGWKTGDTFKQKLDGEINGIIIERKE